MALVQPILPNDIWLVQVYMSIYSQRVIANFHYRVVTPGTEATPFELCDAINTKFKAAGGMMDKMKACTSETLFYDFVQSQRIFPQRTVLVTGIDGDIGDLDAEQILTNSAAVITRRTVLAGRDQVSNLHMVIPQTGATVAAGEVTPGWKLLAEPLRAALYTDIVTAGGTDLEPVIYHQGVPAPDHYQEVHSAVIQDTARVMRRRTVRLGV